MRRRSRWADARYSSRFLCMAFYGAVEFSHGLLMCRGRLAIAESFPRLRFCDKPCLIRALGARLCLFDCILFFHGINSIYASKLILHSFRQAKKKKSTPAFLLRYAM